MKYITHDYTVECAPGDYFTIFASNTVKPINAVFPKIILIISNISRGGFQNNTMDNSNDYHKFLKIDFWKIFDF